MASDMEMEKAIGTAQRKRAMRSSTFRVLAEQMDHPVREWGEDLLDEVIEDTIVIERDRRFERGIWIFVVISLALGAFFAGWNMKPEPQPEPIEWQCQRVYDDTKVDTIDCTGIEF